MKTWLTIGLLLALPLLARAGAAEKGKPFPPYTLTDAFGVTNTLSPGTRFVIVSSEKDVSGRVDEWLKTKEKGFLPAHHAEYVADITPMPTIITSLFALPKMRKFPFTILLARDPNFAKTYPHQDGKIALFTLDEHQVVSDIAFLDKAADLDPILIPAATR